ncbi:MFS transporter [Planomonospora sp. ID82291]|uniref:MFS transporter n=1 Tax=Planomonospora sp. ID82291 TaxID=2738136 RepID=UPI0018C3B164|nr:MFS transporter [Planomonospora sp. ID82291]MBG0818383.1 MFS transporter [Planomonospora sp. ID82291]
MIPRRLAGSVELLRTNAPYRRYAAARLSSTLGTTVAPLGLAFAVIAGGGGAGALSGVLLADLLAFLAVTPVAGVLADRLPRKKIIIAAQVTNACLQTAAAVLVATGTATVAALAGLGVIAGATAACFQPAMKSVLAALVAPEALVEANALIQIGSNLVAIGGPALAGLVIAVGGAHWVLAWDAFTYAVAAVVFRTLRLPPADRARRRPRFWTDLTEGWTAFTGRRWLWVLTMLSMVTSACWAALTVLGPIYTVRYLDGAISWGLINSSIGIGLITGSVTALLLRPARVGVVVCAAAIPEGLLLVSLAAGAPLPVIAAAAGATGAAGTIQLVTWTSFLQRTIPDVQLSRILATTSALGTLLTPVAYALAGPLSELAGVRPVLWGCAALALSGAAVAACVRDVRHTPPGSGPASTASPRSRPVPLD